MKIRLLLLIVLLLLFTFLLTGCLTININTGIDGHNTSFLSYNVELDVSEIDPQYHIILSNALNRFGWHYQEELGFTAGLNTDTELYSLTITKRVQNDSFAQAYESLKNMLTDENMTAFMKVDMSIQSLPRQELYSINTMLDIPQILRLSSAEELSPELLLEFNNAIETAAGTITLTFPVSAVIESSHNINTRNNSAEMKVPLSYTEQTELEFAASLIFMEDGTIGDSFDDIAGQLMNMRNIALIVCAVAALILLVAFIAIFVRR